MIVHRFFALQLEDKEYRQLMRLLHKEANEVNLSSSEGRELYSITNKLIKMFDGRPYNDGDYRVLEAQGRFYVQVLHTTECDRSLVDWLMRRPVKTKTEWIRTDTHGNAMSIYRYLPMPPPSPAFKTLEEAQELINKFKSPTRYHYDR